MVKGHSYRINWKQLLSQHNVYYRTDGPNCAKGHVVVKCPFCGDDDPSEHMGIEFATSRWACWRNSSHRGNNPRRLLVALLKVSYEQANIIIGIGPAPDTQNISEKVRQLLAPSTTARQGRALKLSKQFRPLWLATSARKRFVQYLKRRDFHDINKLAALYELHYAISGPFKDRIIFPIRFDGRLVTWTARSIHANVRIRYLALGKKSYGPQSPQSQAQVGIKDVVFNYDELIDVGGKVLVITEGPIDALKLDYYAKDLDVRATCLFGLTLTNIQVDLLRDLSSMFKQTYILLDRGTLHQSMSLQGNLSDTQVKMLFLPEHLKDPGEMRKRDVRRFVNFVLADRLKYN